MKVYRGSDDDMVYFGHFSEARKVKTKPDDDEIVIDRIPDKDDPDFDDYIAREMDRKKKAGGRSGSAAATPPRGNVGSDRFATSRLKPPGYGKTPPKKPSGDDDQANKDKFKNTGRPLTLYFI
jgi:hypothetical protein